MPIIPAASELNSWRFRVLKFFDKKNQFWGGYHPPDTQRIFFSQKFHIFTNSELLQKNQVEIIKNAEKSCHVFNCRWR